MTTNDHQAETPNRHVAICKLKYFTCFSNSVVIHYCRMECTSPKNQKVCNGRNEVRKIFHKNKETIKVKEIVDMPCSKQGRDIWMLEIPIPTST